MLGAIEQAMHGFRVKGVSWVAKTLTDRGPGAQEKLYGADCRGVLDIDLPDFGVKKGFLAQAKLVRSYLDIRKELQKQCEKMLALSPASFVFLYDYSRVSVIPAVAVVGTDHDPSALYSRTAARFFEEHFESFIGDRDIKAPTPDILEDLRSRYEARRLLYLRATPETL